VASIRRRTSIGQKPFPIPVDDDTWHGGDGGLALELGQDGRL
jgi:hypothetical protein